MLTNIEQELVVAILLQLWSNALSNLSTESLLVLNLTLTEHTVEELLVNLSRLEVTDLSNLEAEVSIQILNLLLLNLQQGSNLSIVIGVSLLGVESDDVASLSTVEQLLLVVGLDVSRHNHGSLGSDTTFLGVTVLVKLAHVTSQCIVTAEYLSLNELTSLRCIHLYLIVEHLIINLDGVIVNLISASQLSLELRSYGNIEHECQIISVLKVLGYLLLLVWEGLTQHLDLVLTNILIQLLAQQLVNLVNLYCCAILLLNHSHGNHTWTESRNLCFLTIIFQLLLYCILIICLLNGHSQQTIDLVGALKRNFHLLMYLFIIYIQILGCKSTKKRRNQRRFFNF